MEIKFKLTSTLTIIGNYSFSGAEKANEREEFNSPDNISKYTFVRKKTIYSLQATYLIVYIIIISC